MSIYDIRRRNLLLLVEELRAEGKRDKDIAAELGDLNPSWLSQLLHDRNMGDKTARKIESARGLAEGWMDWHQSARDSWQVREDQPAHAGYVTTLTPREAALLDYYRRADERGKNVVDATAAAAGQPVSNGEG